MVAAPGRGARIPLAEECQLPVDVIERPLGAVEQDQAGRVELEDLTSQLGSDRAASPRDEYGLAADEVAETRFVDDHRFAAEQVIDLDLADSSSPQAA